MQRYSFQQMTVGRNLLSGFQYDDVADNEKLTQAKADNILRLKQD